MILADKKSFTSDKQENNLPIALAGYGQIL
jgi:hypothetical protein